MMKMFTLVGLYLLISNGVSAQECNQRTTRDSVDQLVSSSSAVFFSNPSTERLKELDELKEKFKCDQGRGRDRVYQIDVDGSYGNNIVSGHMKKGNFESSSSSLYAGVNYGTGDLILISKIDENRFNVVLSFCNYKSEFSTYMSDDIEIVNTFLNIAYLDNSSSTCQHGNVQQAQLSFYNPSYGQEYVMYAPVCFN